MTVKKSESKPKANQTRKVDASTGTKSGRIAKSGLSGFLLDSSELAGKVVFAALAKNSPAVRRGAKNRPPVRGIAAGASFSLKKMDTESAALSHLENALASDSVKKFVRPKIETAESEFKSMGSEAMPLTGTMLVKFRQHFNKIPVYGSLVTIELDKNN